MYFKSVSFVLVQVMLALCADTNAFGMNLLGRTWRVTYASLNGCGDGIAATTIGVLRGGIQALDGDHLDFLDGKNLVSVDECIDAYRATRSADGNDGGNGLKFIDGSWWHKGDLNGRALYEEGPRIPRSKYIDMDDIAAQNELFPELNPKDLPHMLPPKELFVSLMDTYNIQNTDHVIVYGRDTCIFTARTWFLFRSLGHDPNKIHLMQGSLEDWMAKGGEVEMGPPEQAVPWAKDLLGNRREGREESGGSYVARDAAHVCDMSRVEEWVKEGTVREGGVVLLDSRGSSFAKGHIPGARHVPYANLVCNDDGGALKLKSKEELKEAFRVAGLEDVTTDRTVICSCGSGVSACHLFLALEECGRAVGAGNTMVYDGSWAEWGRDASTPKVSEDVC